MNQKYFDLYKLAIDNGLHSALGFRLSRVKSWECLPKLYGYLEDALKSEEALFILSQFFFVSKTKAGDEFWSLRPEAVDSFGIVAKREELMNSLSQCLLYPHVNIAQNIKTRIGNLVVENKRKNDGHIVVVENKRKNDGHRVDKNKRNNDGHRVDENERNNAGHIVDENERNNDGHIVDENKRKQDVFEFLVIFMQLAQMVEDAKTKDIVWLIMVSHLIRLHPSIYSSECPTMWFKHLRNAVAHSQVLLVGCMITAYNVSAKGEKNWEMSIEHQWVTA
eukprot:gene12139-8683_t